MMIDEFIEKRRKQFEQIIVKNIPMKIAVASTVAEMTQRIFIHGENSSGGSIGQYDTKHPLYVNPETSAGTVNKSKIQGIEGIKPTKGKHGDHVFKNGKEHKTTYLNNYKEFRNRIGRPIDRVNLFLTGELMSDFSSFPVASQAIPPHNPVKISEHEYHVTLKRESDTKKVDGIEKKYGAIFHTQTKERRLFVEILNKEVKRIFDA